MPTEIHIDEPTIAADDEEEAPILGLVPLNPMATDHCWSCFVEFCESDTRHEHPLLGIIVCSVCCDGSECVERDVLEMADQNENDNDEDDDSLHCSFCSLPYSDLNPPYPPLSNDASNDLFLCDSCPRAYCRKCVCVSTGGDMKMVRRVEEKEEWACCYCRPTDFLTELQRGYATLLEEDGANNSSDDMVTEDKERIARTIDELIQVESKYADARCHLEDEQMFSKRVEIESELKEHCEGKDLEAAVSDEMGKYQSLWQRNAERLQETIGKLWDELEDEGVNAGDVYKFLEGGEGKIDVEREPRWKREADKALDDRDVKEGFGKGEFRGASGYKSKDTRIYKLEPEDLNPSSLKEIEDINTTLGAVDQMNRLKSNEERANQWGSKTGITQEDIEMFQKKCTKFEEVTLGAKIDLGALEKNYKRDVDDKVCVRNEGSVMTVRKKNGNGPRVVKRTITVQSAKIRDDKETVSAMLSGYSREYVPTIPNLKNDIGAVPKVKKRAKLVSASSSLSIHEFPGMKGVLLGKDVSFDGSDIILPVKNCSAKITVCKPLALLLKRHQIEGVKFCWRIIFENFCQSKAEENVRGAILAHSMGLGKTIQTITIIHTLLTHPSLVRPSASMDGETAHGRLAKKVLLIAPVNTLANWKTEFTEWISKNDVPFIRFLFWDKLVESQKLKLIKEWYHHGGVLCCSSGTYAGTVRKFNDSKEDQEHAFVNKALLSPDMVVLDEAHTMLKNSATATFIALNNIRTKFRLCLTGTPLQNRLSEYYHMANWTSPGCLGSEARFTAKYVKPIMAGMAADCTPAEAVLHDKLSTDLHRSLSSFVHRCSSDVLKETLPFMQQCIVHIRQSKSQTKLYREFNKYKKKKNGVGFFEQYHALKPVSNHPACLPFFRNPVPRANSPLSDIETNIKKTTVPKDMAWVCDKCKKAQFDTFEEAEEHEAACEFFANLDDNNEGNWWDPFHDKVMRSGLNINGIEHGGKIVVLLQILAHCDEIGDKVVVFSNAISTLDFIEECLRSPNWNGFTPQLPDSEYKICDWAKGRDYCRIDGNVDAGQRGELISSFNTLKQLKLFLVSTKAGGLGVNLAAANRVVLFDADWNPAVSNQAIHRCYRYGQTKPVFVYQLLAEGSMEEKIYTRAATKTSLASLIVDEKNIERLFSRREMDLLQENDTWVSCEACNQWRMLPPDVPDDEVANLPEKWYCKDNIYDPDRSTCSAPEQSSSWYAHHWENRENHQVNPFVAPRTNDDTTFEEYTKRDGILQALLERCEGTSTDSGKQINSWISKYSFSKETIQDAEDADSKKIAPSGAENASPKKKKQTVLPSRTSPRKVPVSSPKPDCSTQLNASSTTKSTSPCFMKTPRTEPCSNRTINNMKENLSNLASSENLVIKREQCADKTTTVAVEKKRKSPEYLFGKKKSSKISTNFRTKATMDNTIDLLDSDSD